MTEGKEVLEWKSGLKGKSMTPQESTGAVMVAHQLIAPVGRRGASVVTHRRIGITAVMMVMITGVAMRLSKPIGTSRVTTVRTVMTVVAAIIAMLMVTAMTLMAAVAMVAMVAAIAIMGSKPIAEGTRFYAASHRRWAHVSLVATMVVGVPRGVQA